MGDSREHHAGLDVSLKLSSMCIIDAQGAILREAKVASNSEELVRSVAAALTCGAACG